MLNLKLILIGIAIFGGILIMGIMGLTVFASPSEVNEEKYFTMAGIDEIKIEVSSTQVHIIQTEAGSKMKLHLYGRVKRETKLAALMNNNAVIATVERKYNALPIHEETFLDVYIPEDFKENLSIKATSGLVKMDSIYLADFILDTSSGGLEAKELAAGRITINTTSGKLDIKKFNAKELKIKGTSSKVNVDECITGETGIEISSGSVAMINLKGNFRLKGTSGDVLIACKELNDQNINIETTSGDVTVELAGNAEFLLDAATASGELRSDFPVNRSENTDKRKLKGQIGEKGNKLSLQTSSGRIRILKNDGNS